MIAEILEEDESRIRWSHDTGKTWKYADLDELIDCWEENQWIPVSERLPESSVYVLVTTNSGIITTGIIRESNNEKFWWHRMHEFKEKEIVAWMPLPKPYKAESKDKK